MRGRERDVDVAGLLDGLAAVERLDDGELAGPLLEGPGDAVDVLAALERAHARPVLLVRGPRRLHGEVDVLLGGLGDLASFSSVDGLMLSR